MGSSLAGKTVLVTGATAGIGFQTAAALARSGARVFVTGRDAERGAAAEQRLRAAAQHGGARFLVADAATVGGNEELARRMLAETERLDVLVNNVGGAYNDRWVTADDYEASLAMNFVGPFALTQALVPLLRRSAPARVVNVCSAAHAMWKGDPFVDLHGERSFLGSDAYARSKLLNLAWTLALARRLAGTGVVANAADPGTAWTPMTQGLEARSMPLALRALWPLVRLFQRGASPARAARSSIFLAMSPAAERLTGAYVVKDGRIVRPSSNAVLDERVQDRAWALGETLVSQAPTAAARGSPATRERSAR
jgi:NAD(P)-dependent dehydrogenase (short-subunit alcohol dehydrogenase family)